MSNVNMEEQVTDFIYRAMKDKFMEFIEEKEPKIRAITDELFNDGEAKEWLEEFIQYDDQIRESVRDRVADILAEKMIAQINSQQPTGCGEIFDDRDANYKIVRGSPLEIKHNETNDTASGVFAKFYIDNA